MIGLAIYVWLVVYFSPSIPTWSCLQIQLRRAAKARIHRMIQPKSKRKELVAPEYVAKEWKEGDKNGMADLLLKLNFKKDPYMLYITWTYRL